jgi:hypothetical protein
MTSRHTKKRVATVLGAGAAICALSLGRPGVAEAKITPVDIQCTNRGGHAPEGQPTTCKGNGLIQETENQNPAGHAPPGHN